MSFNTDPIKGEWWIADDGKRVLESFHNIKRGNRRIRIRRSLDYRYRIYKNRTDGSDGDVQSMDQLELWNDPIEGEPNSASDWLVNGAEMDFDISTGMVDITVSAVNMPTDWEHSSRISEREFL